MATNRKRSLSFRKGLLIYAVILALVLAIGLFIFYKYIESYENARPTHALTSYYDNLSEDNLLEQLAM